MSLDIINELFQSVGIGAQHHPAEDYVSLSEDAGNKFIFSSIDYSTVSTPLSSLDVKKSTGSDQLSS